MTFSFYEYIIIKGLVTLNKLKDKESILITSDVIEECLSESLDIIEKETASHNKSKKQVK